MAKGIQWNNEMILYTFLSSQSPLQIFAPDLSPATIKFMQTLIQYVIVSYDFSPFWLISIFYW